MLCYYCESESSALRVQVSASPLAHAEERPRVQVGSWYCTQWYLLGDCFLCIWQFTLWLPYMYILNSWGTIIVILPSQAYLNQCCPRRHTTHVKHFVEIVSRMTHNSTNLDPWNSRNLDSWNLSATQYYFLTGTRTSQTIGSRQLSSVKHLMEEKVSPWMCRLGHQESSPGWDIVPWQQPAFCDKGGTCWSSTCSHQMACTQWTERPMPVGVGERSPLTSVL